MFDVFGPVGRFVELHALEHGALEAFYVLSGCRSSETDDLLFQLEQVKVLRIVVEEEIKFVNDDEITFFGLELKTDVVMDPLFTANRDEVLLVGFIISLHEVFCGKHYMNIPCVSLDQSV